MFKFNNMTEKQYFMKQKTSYYNSRVNIDLNRKHSIQYGGDRR